MAASASGRLDRAEHTPFRAVRHRHEQYTLPVRRPAPPCPAPLGAGGRSAPAATLGLAFFVAPFALIFRSLPHRAAALRPLDEPLRHRSLATGTQFTWFGNYLKAFTDPIFLEGLGSWSAFSFVMIPCRCIVALPRPSCSTSSRRPAPKFSRLMIFLPYAIPASSARSCGASCTAPLRSDRRHLRAVRHDGADFLAQGDHLLQPGSTSSRGSGPATT